MGLRDEGFRAYGAPGSGFWVSGFGFRVLGFGFRALGLGFRVLGVFRVCSRYPAAATRALQAVKARSPRALNKRNVGLRPIGAIIET